MKPADNVNNWLVYPQPNPDAQLQLICFHYAGCGAAIFHPWPDYLPTNVQVCAIRLPGRETRFKEPLFTDIDSLIQSLIHPLLTILDKPFAFFGHSMGALISFELSRFLRKNYGLSPQHLFVSSRCAPQLAPTNPPLHNLPESNFIEKLCEFNGIPQAVLADKELMQIFLPILRADFSVLETYSYTAEQPLNFAITTFGGMQDSVVSVRQLEAWQAQTNQSFSLQMFPGDHFFINTAKSSLLTSISKTLEELL
jgi:medium-chain acyl-[acyl-carrier-protein] hydrolase